jgi:serine/threonine protein kinase
MLPLPSTSDYMVGPSIGQGSFAHVVYARHKATNREVAVKVMDHATMRRRPALVGAVWTERKLLRRLRDSPWVVNLLASFYDSHCVYLVMDLATFGDLECFIMTMTTTTTTQRRSGGDSCGNGSEQQEQPSVVTRDRLHSFVPSLASQIMEAVESLHTQHSILHCDLKPGNILLTEDPRASSANVGGCGLRILLSDFASAVELRGDDCGCCGQEEEEEGDEVDEPEQRRVQFLPRGTCDYASPEIVRGKPPSQLTVAADYWSVGCIFHAMLHNGVSPFHGEDGSEARVIHSIVTHRLNDGRSHGNWQLEGGVPEHQRATSGADYSSTECDSCSERDSNAPGHLPLLPTQVWVSSASLGLIQASPVDRVNAWRMTLCHRYKNGSSASKECCQNNNDMIEISSPAWRDRVEKSTLLDGKIGWTAFQAIA